MTPLEHHARICAALKALATYDRGRHQHIGIEMLVASMTEAQASGAKLSPMMQSLNDLLLNHCTMADLRRWMAKVPDFWWHAYPGIGSRDAFFGARHNRERYAKIRLIRAKRAGDYRVMKYWASEVVMARQQRERQQRA